MAKVKMTAKDYDKYGTVKSGGKKKFPIKNATSAKNALDLMGNAKPALSSSQRARIKSEAASYGVKPKKGTKAQES